MPSIRPRLRSDTLARALKSLAFLLTLAVLCLVGTLVVDTSPHLFAEMPRHLSAYLLGAALFFAFLAASIAQRRAQRREDQKHWTDLFD